MLDANESYASNMLHTNTIAYIKTGPDDSAEMKVVQDEFEDENLIYRSDDEDDDVHEMLEEKFVPSTAIEASTSSSHDFYNITSHPRFSHLQSESRRKSTPPMRIQQVTSQSYEKPATKTKSIRVRGVIRDPSNSKCLYLLVEKQKPST
jgi:hypothetical protein